MSELIGREPADLTEAELAIGFVAGGPGLLAEAYRRWGSLVYDVVRRRIDDQRDAEEVTRQVFVWAWRNRESLVPSATMLPGWLTGIAARKAADLLAARRDSTELPALIDTDVDPAGRIDRQAVSRAVLSYQIDALGDPRRTVLKLAIVENRTAEQISEQLRMPLDTVRVHVHGGLLHLRDRLREVFGAASD